MVKTTRQFIVIGLIGGIGSVSALGAEAARTQRFFSALRKVETGDSPNGGRHAVGDHGKSLGPYQIQKRYWRDSGVRGRYENVRSPQYAERVMTAYWEKYCPKALQRGDYRTLARIHNGGPTGHRNPTTLRYWKKVRSALSK